MSNDCEQLLRDVLPPKGYYCLASQSPNQKGMHQEFFTDVTAMATRIGELDNQSRTVYFAPASFSAEERQQGSVLAVKSFWFDIDCGEDKAKSGQGYAKQDDAAKQIASWLETNKLPIPTFVNSGNGLHLYWCLHEAIAPSDWKACAQQLKQLVQAGHLRVDPSRTTDSASLMRPVGTRNRKPGKDIKDVQLLKRALSIDFPDFRERIGTALGTPPELSASRAVTPQKHAPHAIRDATASVGPKVLPRETEEAVAQVRQALAVLDPDSGYQQWFQILASLQWTRWDSAKRLAMGWSKGAFSGCDAQKFDESGFEKTWLSLHGRDVEDPITLGTLFALAKQSGYARITEDSPENNDEFIEQMNGDVCFIESQSKVFDKKYGRFLSTTEFDNKFANWSAPKSIGGKPSLAHNYWRKSLKRETYTDLELAPGEGPRTNAGAFNLYRGFSCAAAPGDTSPWTELLQLLVPNSTERSYFERFMAYKIQNPGVPYTIAVLLRSATQGVGKNSIVEAWASLFHKDHYIVRGSEVFGDQFTEWRSGKLAIILDEVAPSGRRQVADCVKGWITGATNAINAKNQPKYDERNLAVHVFLSNHVDALYLTKEDRRFWVCECTETKPDKDVFDRFYDWLENDGRPALLAHMQQLDIGAFNPKVAPPMTRAKEEMIEDNKTDVERKVAEVVGQARAAGQGDHQLVTVDDIKRKVAGFDGLERISDKVVARALRDCGCVKVGKPALLKTGCRTAVWSIDNHAGFEAMSSRALGDTLNGRVNGWKVPTPQVVKAVGP